MKREREIGGEGDKKRNYIFFYFFKLSTMRLISILCCVSVFVTGIFRPNSTCVVCMNEHSEIRKKLPNFRLISVPAIPLPKVVRNVHCRQQQLFVHDRQQ